MAPEKNLKRRRRWPLLLGLAALLVLPLLYLGNSMGRSYPRNGSAGIAPQPLDTDEAVLQVYGAGAYGWRGLIADHTWIAAKKAGAESYTIYQVIGWRLRRGRSVVSISEGVPDRYWWGSIPKLYLDRRGGGVDELIDRVHRAALDYPYGNEYTVWPGPNSNSFTAWIALEVPELALDLPWRAIGKGWMKANYARLAEAAE